MARYAARGMLALLALAALAPAALAQQTGCYAEPASEIASGTWHGCLVDDNRAITCWCVRCRVRPLRSRIAPVLHA